MPDEAAVAEFMDQVQYFFKVCDDLRLGRYTPVSTKKRDQYEEEERMQELFQILYTVEVISSISQLKATETASFGLHMTIGSINQSMLQYNEIKDTYFRAVHNLFMQHTARLYLLDDALFVALVDSLHFALSQTCGSKSERLSLEIIQKVSEFLFVGPSDAPPWSPPKRQVLSKFVHAILTYLLFEDGFNFEMIDLAASSFLALVRSFHFDSWDFSDFRLVYRFALKRKTTCRLRTH